MNTHAINHYVSNLTFDGFCFIDDTYFVVDLDYLTNRDYQNQGVNELLYLVGIYTDKIFIFLARDGVNCDLTGLTYVIKNIVKNLQLTRDRCFIYGYENLNLSNTTFVEFDALQMWCTLVAKELQNLPSHNTKLTKKFAGLFGRHDIYRLKLVRHLFDNYRDDSILSYNSHIGNWNYRFAGKFFLEDQEWYKKNCPILLDYETASGWVPYQKSLAAIKNHYQHYFVEIVCETDPHSSRFFTEKTLKNFYLNKAFVLFSGAGSLQYLHSKGFRTFGQVIDESYDSIECPNRRLTAIMAEIDRIAALNYTELTHAAMQLDEVFDHNRKNFLKYIQ